MYNIFLISFIGITKFSDLSQEEFKKRYLNLILPEKFDETKFIYLENKVNATAELVDWSANGKTTAVKDQVYIINSPFYIILSIYYYNLVLYMFF